MKSNLCDYKDAYILVRGDITIIKHQVTQVIADDAEDLDSVMPLYKPIKYNIKHKAIDFNANIVNTDNFKLFKYKANFLGNTEAYEANEILKNTTIAVPLTLFRMGFFGAAHGWGAPP